MLAGVTHDTLKIGILYLKHKDLLTLNFWVQSYEAAIHPVNKSPESSTTYC